MHLHDIPTPALLLDLDRLRANCERMKERTRRAGVRLRPHLKTLKSIDAARLAVDDSGGITVSTLLEAEYFAGHGITDIVIGVCLAPSKFARALALATHMARMSDTSGAGLAVIVDDAGVAAALARAAHAAREQAGAIGVWIEIDSGEHRTGVDPAGDALLSVAQALVHGDAAGAISFRGVFTHGGHSYRCSSIDAVRAVAEQERSALVMAAERLQAAGIACPGRSAGSTPTATHGQNWQGVTELRPGVYMAGDLFQQSIGSMASEDMAVTVLASVISHQHATGQMVVDAGGLALSKDRSMAGRADDTGYGTVLSLDEQPTGLHVAGVHQEHGELEPSAGGSRAAAMERFPVGSRVRIVPNHVCMTAAAHPAYHVVQGQQVVATWERVNGW